MLTPTFIIEPIIFLIVSPFIDKKGTSPLFFVTVAFGLPLSCDFPSIFYTAVMFAYRTCIFLCAHRAVPNIFTLINSKYRFKNHWLITPCRMRLNHLQKISENEKRLSPKGEPWIINLVTHRGIEPRTYWLRVSCSASWASES